MGKTILNLTKLFIIHAKENNILELDINELRENFYQMKQVEKYQKLLSSYEYDENHICLKLEKEIQQLTKDEQISIYKNMIYIYNINLKPENHYTHEINSLVDQMITDYIMLNMKKQKSKVG